METSFLNLARGNRLTAYLGLQMAAGYSYKYAPDYTYIEIPLMEFWNPSEEKVQEDKALRNQYVRVIPACSLTVRGSHYKIEVEPNPALAEFGLIQPGYYLHTAGGGGELSVPGFYMQVRRDVHVKDVDYAVRLYMRQ